MDYEKFLQKNEWKQEEAIASILVLDMFRTSHVEGNRVYDGDLIEDAIFVLHDGYAYEWTKKDQVKKMQEWVWETFQEDKSYLESKFDEYQEVLDTARDLYEEHFNKTSDYSNDELVEVLSEMDAMVSELYAYAMIPEGLDLLSGDDWEKHLPNVSAERRPEIIQSLSSFGELSFSEEYKKELLSLASKFGLAGLNASDIKKRVEKSEELKKEVENLMHSYGWIKSSFEWWFELTSDMVCEKIAEFTKENSADYIASEIEELENKKERHNNMREELYENHDISDKSKKFFAMVRFLSLIQDMRKEGVLRTVALVGQIGNLIEEKYDIPHEELRKYYVEELIDLLENDKKTDISDKSYVAYHDYYEDGEVQLDRFAGERAKQMWNIIKQSHKEDEGGSLSGFVASTGDQDTVTGTARIVFDPNEDDALEEGEILVTGMTRPEFAPLMKKAKGIVTNEGGITTHAAIVSRELGKPCIIGTQNATEKIENGDKVELDLQDGTVSKLEQG